MKKNVYSKNVYSIISCLVVFLLSLSLAGMVTAASLSRDMPLRVSPGEEVVVNFRISGMEAGKEAGVSEVVPEGITIKEQSVAGSDGRAVYQVAGKNNHKWSFKALGSSCTITYKFNAPNEVGQYNFDAVYALPPANIDNIKSVLNVRVITCGDGVCEGNEDSDSCERDCPKPVISTPPEEAKEKPDIRSIIGWVIVGVIVAVGLIVYFAVSKRKK